MGAEPAMDSVPSIAPTFRLQWEEVQGAFVLLYPEGMIKLNRSAGEILKRCDGNRTVGGIIADLERAFPGAKVQEDVARFVATAHAEGWIRYRGTAEAPR